MSDSMIEQSAERLFSDQVDRKQLEAFEEGQWPQALWDQVCELGFPMALASEQADGIGANFDEAYPILRGIGFWQVPLPLAETMVASMLLSLAGIGIPDGPIAMIEAARQPKLRVDGSGGTLTLSGQAQRVPWAPRCAWALVSDSAGRIGLIALNGNRDVRIETAFNMAKEPTGQVDFQSASMTAVADNPLPGLNTPVWALGALARSIMIVGALESALEQSTRYVNERIQFGKPIGKNQAIQQSLAVLAGDTGAARMAARIAALGAPSSQRGDCGTAPFDVAVAKIRAGEAATRATSIAHQVHGAIGFTFEHSLNYATRRLWSWRQEYGTDAWWAERLGQAAIRAGAAGFWPGMTSRSLGSLA